VALVGSVTSTKVAWRKFLKFITAFLCTVIQCSSFCECIIDLGLVQVMESVLRFVFIEHLNNVKSAKYWGPDAPRLVFQFEVQYVPKVLLVVFQTLVD